MKRIVQVKISKGEKYYVAECLDLPVVSQGETIDEAARNTRDTIALNAEGEKLNDLNVIVAPLPTGAVGR